MCQGRTLVVAVLALGAALFAVGPCSGAEQLPDSQLGSRTAPLLLLSRRDVQADLGMTAEVVAEAEKAITALYTRASQIRGMSGEKAIAERRAIDEQQLRWLEQHLSESQRIRLDQIDLQWEGAAALVSRPSMAESLGLNPEQLGTLKRLFQEGRSRRSRGETGPQSQRWFAGQAFGVLSEAQRKSWMAMLGKPFQPQLAAAPAQTKPR